MTGRPTLPALRFPPAVVRPGLRVLQRSVFDPRVPWATQRRRLAVLDRVTRARRGTTITPGRAGGVPTLTVAAPDADPGRVVVHFHGGGFTIGTPGLGRAWASLLSERSGATVVLPDYRLAPEAPAPAAAADARAVWQELAAGTGPAPVLSGDSAGGGIALALAQSLDGGGGRAPSGLVLVSPWIDLQAERSVADAGRDRLLTTAWLEACVRAYVGDGDRAAPTVSPRFGPLEGLPPLLVQAGVDDVLIADADHLVTETRAAGGRVTYLRLPGMWHDFPLHAGVVAAADRAVVQAARFVADRLGSPAQPPVTDPRGGS